MSNVSEVTKDNFASEVLEANLPVIVDFWAAWCGPCKMFSPIIDSLAAAHQGKFKVVKINVDEQQELAAKYDIMSIPTVILFKDGKDVDTQAGALPQHMLEQWLQKQGVL